MAQWMGLSPRAGLRGTAAAVGTAIVLAVVAAVAAAAPAARLDSVDAALLAAADTAVAAAFQSVAAAAARAARGGEVPAVGRPLAVGVSVLTDDAYVLADATQTRYGCPPSVTIASPLAMDNGTFLVAPAGLTVDGAGCTGAAAESVLVGFTGAALLDVVRGTGVDLTPLLDVDPQAALAFVYEAPITCGAVVLGGERLWTFAVTSAVPLLHLSGEDDPAAGCTLVDSTATAPSAAAAGLVAAAVTTAGVGERSLAAAAAVRAPIGGAAAIAARRDA